MPESPAQVLKAPLQGKKDKDKGQPKTTPVKEIQRILATSAGAEQIGYINELVEKQWIANKIEPSEGVRRLHLHSPGVARPDRPDRQGQRN